MTVRSDSTLPIPALGRLAHEPGHFPVSEETGRRCLALPFPGAMTDLQIDTVCGALGEAIAHAGTAWRAIV